MLQYADDIALYTICNNIQEGKNRLEIALREIEIRLSGLGLEIEPTKTNVVMFNNRKDRENSITIRIKGQRIYNVKEARFLGVVIDSKINFERQITQVHLKAEKFLNILRFLNRVTWDMETHHL